jgi:hypothetical protein
MADVYILLMLTLHAALRRVMKFRRLQREGDAASKQNQVRHEQNQVKYEQETSERHEKDKVHYEREKVNKENVCVFSCVHQESLLKQVVAGQEMLRLQSFRLEEDSEKVRKALAAEAQKGYGLGDKLSEAEEKVEEMRETTRTLTQDLKKLQTDYTRAMRQLDESRKDMVSSPSTIGTRCALKRFSTHTHITPDTHSMIHSMSCDSRYRVLSYSLTCIPFLPLHDRQQ